MAPLIPAATMTRLRAIDERAMPSTCRVLRRSDVESGGRVAPGTETQVGGTVSCRLTRSTLKPEEREAVGRLGDETYGVVALPVGTEILSGDRLEVTTGASVTTFEVVGDPWPTSYGTNLRVQVKRED